MTEIQFTVLQIFVIFGALGVWAIFIRLGGMIE